MTNLELLFKQELRVINAGLRSFAEDLIKQNIKVVHVNWKPPAGGNAKMLNLLNKLKKKL